MMRNGMFLFVAGLLVSAVCSTSAQLLPGNRTSTETIISPTVAKTLINEEYAHVFNDPDYITVSARGKCIVQELTTPQGRTVSVNGIPGATFTRVPESVHFIEGDSVCYYAITGGKLCIVRDGILGHPIDGLKLMMVAHWMPNASVTDSDISWGAMGMIIPNTGLIVTDIYYCEGQSFLAIPGKHVIYVAKRAGKQFIILVIVGNRSDRVPLLLKSQVDSLFVLQYLYDTGYSYHRAAHRCDP